MLEKEKEQEVISLCQSMIQAQSYSGHEDQAAKILTEYFKSHGYDEVITDDYGNVIGHIRGKQPGPKILFDGHMDTVPVTNEAEWPYPPFGAEIHDGKIYGRGTSDMKVRSLPWHVHVPLLQKKQIKILQETFMWQAWFMKNASKA